MKKFIVFFSVCCIVLLSIFCIYYKPTSVVDKVRSVYKTFDQMFQKDVELYTADVLVNELSVEGSDYYFKTLNDNQKLIYTAIANSVKDFIPKFEIKGYNYVDDGTTNDDVEVAVYRFLLDHPEVFYISDNYLISTTSNILRDKVEISFSYLVDDKQDLENKISKLKDKIDEILLNVKDKNDFQTELYIHDYIAKNSKYYEYDNIDDIPINCHNIYGALIENSAVCDGFAKSMKLILNKCGIDSIIVTGKLKNESHAWNFVKINEKWYNLDLTSDKSIKNVDNSNSYVIHSYFNIPDKLILESHTFDNKDILPEADSNEMNFYIVEDKHIQSNESFSNKFSDILNSSKNEELLEFSTDIEGVPNKISTEFSYKHYNSEYVDRGSSKFSYYKILNTYVLLKAK